MERLSRRRAGRFCGRASVGVSASWIGLETRRWRQNGRCSREHSAGLHRPSPNAPVGQQVQLVAGRSTKGQTFNLRNPLGRSDDSIDPSGLVEDLDSHRGSCVEAARGVDAQATHASAIGVVGQVEVKIGLLKAGNSIAAYLETRDELTAAVGDVEQGLVRGQAEARRLESLSMRYSHWFYDTHKRPVRAPGLQRPLETV